MPDPIAIVEERMRELRLIQLRKDITLIEACRTRDRWFDDCWRARNELAVAMRRIDILERLTDALSAALISGEKE